MAGVRLCISLLKNPCFRYALVANIVPLLLWAEADIFIVDGEVLKHNISRLNGVEVQVRIVAQCKGPVLDRSSQWSPETVLFQ
jgi:hypothetical protein